MKKVFVGLYTINQESVRQNSFMDCTRRHTTEGNGQKLGIQHAVSEHTIRVEFNHISARYHYRNREDEVNLRQYLAHSLAIECISRLTAVELNEVDTLLDKIAKDVSEVY